MSPCPLEPTVQPWKLAETNYGAVKQLNYQVAVLPLGATEPHNLHLPYGMDTIEGGTIGEKICEAAHQRGAKVVLLPTIPYGTQTNQKEYPLAMNLYPSTVRVMIGDLVESLVRSGIIKIVLLNSHGGNDLKWVLREMYGQSPAQLFLCNWYTAFSDVYDEIFDVRDDHAGEMETSFALAHCPELIGRNEDGTLTADEGRAAETRFEAVNRGWVSISRPWHLLTTNAGVTDPHAATAEKGRRMMEVLVERLSQFLLELSEAELDERFPY
jgi:creatinine amidohydrolase